MADFFLNFGYVLFFHWPWVFTLICTLYITGIVLTSRTVCARLQLTDDQLKLWMQEERETKLSECQDSGDGVHTDLPAVNFQPGCYAHLTLAHTSHCNPVQAGLDLLDIIKLEKMQLLQCHL